MDFSEVDLSKLRAKYQESQSCSVTEFAAECIYRCMELADAGAAEKMREEFGL